VGIVLAQLGAPPDNPGSSHECSHQGYSPMHAQGVREVVLTDMGPTMDILKKNAKENACAGVSLTTQELEWYESSVLLSLFL
jgi:hypothetical protein